MHTIMLKDPTERVDGISWLDIRSQVSFGSEMVYSPRLTASVVPRVSTTLAPAKNFPRPPWQRHPSHGQVVLPAWSELDLV
jgi:hypothetical protein